MKEFADHVIAHQHSINHREELERSTLCGCFDCLHIFPPTEIEEWIDEDDTALCPKCGIDSVIGDASGYEISREFLKKMMDYWF